MAGAKQLYRLQSDDPVLQRVIDAFIAKLNPVLKRVAYTPTRYTSTNRPAASADWAGEFIRVQDSGAAEQLQTSLARSDGTWEWVIVAIASR